MKTSVSYRVHTAEHKSTCLVCNGSRLSGEFKIYGYKLSRCRDCGFRFLNPAPTEATLLALNMADCVSGSALAESNARVAQLKSATARSYLDFLSRYLGKEGGRLLDVGCGRGELLAEAEARGFDVTGIDISAHSAAIANRRLSEEKVLVGRVENLSFPEASFDAVVLADVLDHIPEPMPLLRRIHGILKPGGTALIVTPSVDSWSARLMRRLWMEYMPQHVLYFGKRSLKRALEGSGFADVTIEPNLKVLDFDYVCHRLDRFPVALITPALQVARKHVPENLAYRQVELAASGVAAIAKKSGEAIDQPK